MFKRNSLRKYFTLILMFFTVVIGFSSWIIVGERTDSFGQSMGVAVAYVSSNPSTKYTRIEKALEMANDGDTVFVIPGTNPIIWKDCIIKKGVSLTIPFTDEIYNGRQMGSTFLYSSANVDSDFSDASKYSTTYLKNTITVKKGVEIIIDGGELNIGGVIGGEAQGISGHTSGNYTQIKMCEDSKIIVKNGGVIDCMGYIKESYNSTNIDTKKGNGSKLILEKGTLYTPFVIYDYRGGSSTVGSYDKGGISPFSVFDCPNVHTNIQCNYGSNIIGYADLYTGATNLYITTVPAQHNTTNVLLVGSANSDINLNPGTTLYSKFSSSTPENVTSTSGDNAAKTTLRFEGVGAKLGSMKLAVSVAGSDQNVDTASVFFPISYRFDIELISGLYDISYDVKFLTGVNLFIGEKATLNINNDVIFYSEFADGSTISPKYPEKSASSVKVDGTLNINNSAGFGGLINPGINEAVLNVDVSDESKLTVATVEGTGSRDGLSFSFNKTNDINEDAEGPIDNTSNITKFNKNVYYSNSSCWQVNSSVLKYYYSFETNGGDTISNQSYVTESSNIIIPEYIDNIVIPRRQGYKFLGWYLDSSFTNKANGTSQTVSNNSVIKMYAKWEKDITQVVSVKLTASPTSFDKNSSGYTSNLTLTIKDVNGNNLDLSYVNNITWNSSNLELLTITKDPNDLLKATANVKLKEGEDVKVKITATVYDFVGNAESGEVSIALNDGSCLLPGTMITMADGSKKAVEQVQPGDMLKVFNHYTGEYDVSPVVFNDSEPKQDINVINLEFSNGSNIGVVYEHGFFDLDLMKYVYIDEYNYNDYVGHRFYSDGNNIVTLNRAYITTQYTEVYSPVTAYHLNYFTEDILSMPGGIEGLFNIFEYDDDLKYNEELMKQDIEKYGLYTYDDFKDYCSYEFYQAFPAEYLKVAVGKGYIAFDEIIYLINRYKNKV